MKKMSREDFLKTSSLALATVLVPGNLISFVDDKKPQLDEKLIIRLIKGNDSTVEKLLQQQNETQQRQYYRNLSGPFANLTAAFCNDKSTYFKSSNVIESLELIIDKLLKLQYPNGTLDSAGNRQSPPDTAFLLESLCPAAKIINLYNFDELKNVKSKLDKFLINAGEGIKNGGVHTPNHRWEIASVLAQLYSIFKDQKYLDRINEWMDEGIFIDADDNYPERSRNYAIVENNAFITLGKVLNQPKLFETAKKNLISSYYFLEEDGELVSLNSRRQDQFNPISILSGYLTYRYIAIHENDGFLSAVTRKIELLNDFEKTILSRTLPFFMADPILFNELPKSETLPKNYTKIFHESNLVRIKRDTISASIFGGNDKPLIIASGRSCNPTFFTFRKGKAILEYARLSTSFFSMGYFRSDGIEIDSNKYILSEKKEAYYYHPLPSEKRNKNGDYKLTESLDGRFWSKMDFNSRPVTTLTLSSKIIIQEENNKFKIDFDIEGPENVEITLDLCFDQEGNLEGVEKGDNENDYFLNNGFAKYTIGNDTIEIGPGKAEHNNLYFLDGEVYSTHFGTIKGKGKHLYITGLVPFKHSITIQ